MSGLTLDLRSLALVGLSPGRTGSEEMVEG